MKASVEDLRKTVEGSAAAEEAAGEAVAEVTGQEAATTEAGTTASSAMQEFAEFKKAEMQLKEVMQEESPSPGLKDSVAEFLADPEARDMLTELWHGKGDGGPSKPAPNPPAPKEHPDSDPQPFEDSADEGANDAPDAEAVYEFMMGMMGTMVSQKPDMSVEEAMQNGQQNKGEIVNQIEENL